MDDWICSLQQKVELDQTRQCSIKKHTVNLKREIHVNKDSLKKYKYIIDKCNTVTKTITKYNNKYMNKIYTAILLKNSNTSVRGFSNTPIDLFKRAEFLSHHLLLQDSVLESNFAVMET